MISTRSKTTRLTTNRSQDFTNTHNYSGGPGVLPESVLQKTQEAIRQAPGTDISLLGISHRSAWFRNVLDEAEANIRTLLNVPYTYHILFLQGGGTMQFSMVPMNMLKERTQCADYITTGYWSEKAVAEAEKEGAVNQAWNGCHEGFHRLPAPSELKLSNHAAYLHYVSNETVEGLQFPFLPGLPHVPRVCDMSSDFLSKPFDITNYSLVYAHAQKNLGPAGVTIAIVHEDVLRNAPDKLPSIMDYRLFAEHRSNFNTPPVFAIYTVNLVTRWLLDEIGGLVNMSLINSAKAAVVYASIDLSDGFYRGRASCDSRSQMNASFTLPNEKLTTAFLHHACMAGFVGLEGHRSVGGIRASLYNGLTLEAAEDLAEFMNWFRSEYGCYRHSEVRNG